MSEQLQTFGGLRLIGHGFSREKPLVFLAYLSLEGKQDRDSIARVFWAGAADPLNSLRVMAYQLGRDFDGVLEASKSSIWTSVRTDAHSLSDSARAYDHPAVLEQYRGTFLDGVRLTGMGEELEEWIVSKRQQFALLARASCIAVAQRHADRGRHSQARDFAERALGLAYCPPLEEQDMQTLYDLLLATGSPLASDVEREATELGITVEKRVGQLAQNPMSRNGELHSGFVDLSETDGYRAPKATRLIPKDD